jgi:hypothetical protein
MNCTEVIASNTTSTYIEVINESVVISSKSLVDYYSDRSSIVLGMHICPIFNILNQYS